MRVAALVMAFALGIGIAVFPNAGRAASPTAPSTYVPPSEQQLASIGCIVAGTATVAVVGTVGVMGVAAGGGAAAVYSADALPILGAAFAAGCGVGMMAAPGAAWLIDQVGNFIMGREEAVSRSRSGGALPEGPVELALANSSRR